MTPSPQWLAAAHDGRADRTPPAGPVKVLRINACFDMQATMIRGRNRAIARSGE